MARRKLVDVYVRCRQCGGVFVRELEEDIPRTGGELPFIHSCETCNRFLTAFYSGDEDAEDESWLSAVKSAGHQSGRQAFQRHMVDD